MLGKRPSATARGYGAKWQRESQEFLALPENRWCAYCKRRGKNVSATQVDHCIPHRGVQKLFWSRRNWQGLCASCGGEKSGKENIFYRTGKPVTARGCDASGVPVDPEHPWNK